MSRKLKIFYALEAFVTLLLIACLFGVVDSAGQCFVTFTQWAEFTKWNCGIYAVGNVGEHVSKNIHPNGPVASA